MLNNIKRYAFTLAEVMVVLAIVTAIVGVSVKITKAKYESANRYLYYSAYSNLKTLIAEVHLNVNSATQSCQCVNSDGSTFTIVAGTTEDECLDACTNGAPAWRPLPNAEGELCAKLVEYANMENSASRCDSGSSKELVEVAANSEEKDFYELVPNIILRNGVKIYSLRTPSALSMFSASTVKNEDGSTNVLQTAAIKNGYKIYVDIDGDRNNSILWEDIFPFYITLNGYVIPAFNESGLGGANNVSDIQASIKYDDVAANGKVTGKWQEKGVTYQDAACHSGFIDGGTYCSGKAVVEKCKKTSTQFNNCQIQVIAPIKF